MAHHTKKGCRYGPGKFEGEPAIMWLAYQAMCDGAADDDTAGVAFFKAPFDDLLSHWDEQDAFCQACCRASIAEYAGDYGFAIEESEQGFVTGAAFATAAEYDAALARCEDFAGTDAPDDD